MAGIWPRIGVLGGVINTAGPQAKQVGVVLVCQKRLQGWSDGRGSAAAWAIGPIPSSNTGTEFFVVAADPTKRWPTFLTMLTLWLTYPIRNALALTTNERKRSALRQPGMLVGKAETLQ